MKVYTKYKRGSIWRKWDLHIHTPGTKKNDQYLGKDIDEKWENFVKDINGSNESIAVIGITDYFSIENYFIFKRLVAEGKITKSFDLIIPNIELRVTPVTGSGTPINIHCIFNPDIENEIETRFLSKLKFSHARTNYSAKKEELIRLGKDYAPNTSLSDSDALKAGIEQYVISFDVLREVFEQDSNLRDNTIIVVSNRSTDGVTGITKHSDFFTEKSISQLDATRKSIYQLADAIFSSNPKDVSYFTANGVDDKITVIEKCGKLMPCFHGCDAHKNDNIFKPVENRYCWIKADPTFEGLKQTLYEPYDRVKIQSIEPDIKNVRNIISEIKFIDGNKLFNDQPIQINENLNAIIGGKSSGKSLLLYSIARSIDPEQVDKAANRLEFDGYKFSTNFDFEVTWKDGDRDYLNNVDFENKTHKITYIPQLYINYLVEKNNREELNKLIQNILLQDSTFKHFYDSKNSIINNNTTEIERLVNELFNTRKEGVETSNKSKELGKSDNIKDGIKKLEKEIDDGKKASNLNDEDFKNYNELLLEKNGIENTLRSYSITESALKQLLEILTQNKENLFGKKNNEGQSVLKGQVDKLLEEALALNHELSTIKDSIKTDFEKLINNLELNIKRLGIKKNQEEALSKLKQNETLLKPFLKKLEDQNELTKLTSRLENEKIKEYQAIELERKIESLKKEYHSIIAEIARLLKERYETYKQIETYINKTKNNIGSEILLNTNLIFKKVNFPLFEQSNKASMSNDHLFFKIFDNDIVNYDYIPKLFGDINKLSEDKLSLNNGIIFPLKINSSFDDIIRGLIKDAFDFDYTVTYKGDELLKMSPGKKGTVLLILFIQISSSEYPILIDQPEDNLDNRTIYDLLCQMIKEKKKERQIIIVSHNANLVVATDTENIIVANQKGENNDNSAEEYRFEYVNGSLEFSFKDTSSKEILFSQGIKEHVCDILEGGNEAFKQRERKYSIK